MRPDFMVKCVLSIPFSYRALIESQYYRKQGLARQLMNGLEETTEKIHDAYFVDLFVRISNAAAIQMYKKVRSFFLIGKKP